MCACIVFLKIVSVIWASSVFIFDSRATYVGHSRSFDSLFLLLALNDFQNLIESLIIIGLNILIQQDLFEKYFLALFFC